MRIHIHPGSGLPVYRQIMDQLRYFIAGGVLNSGDKLPSIRAMARDLAVNPSTVVKAYSELEHEGTIVNRQGMGAYVADAKKRLSSKEQNSAIADLARQLWVRASQLGIDTETVDQIIEQERERIEHEK